RRLVDLPDGRYAATYSADSIRTPAAHQSDARAVTQLLSFDALLRSQENDPDGALASCQAALNAARSIGDEPDMVAMFIRLSCRSVGAGRLERVLGQGGPSQAALQRFQELLETEESEPVVLNALRGERARADRFMEGLVAGKITLSQSELQEYAAFADQDA